ncbi:MAG: hypothetical protein PHY16_18815 [Methylobacter sp.]|nr:hypothetical protein [Methylobacter sp.]
MAVNLNREDSSSSPSVSIDPIQEFRLFVQPRIVDSYCDESMYLSFVQYAVSKLSISSDKAQVVLDLELERLFIANENKLLRELTEALHRFTDDDKKLDNKEETDALQMVCKADLGYRYGLKYDTAQRAIDDFCRANGVKKKKGLFSWAIP